MEKLLQNQQQQPQQYQDSSKDVPSQHNQPRLAAQPIKQNQFVYFNEPQVQYQPEIDQQQQLEPKVISEEEYLELVRRQNGESVNSTAAPKYPAHKAGQYKPQHKDFQRSYVPNEHPQSYLKSYANPLGDFSLEKELAQLEKSNKAIYHEHSEKETQQTSKKERYEFKPSHQFVEYQQDQFLPSEYTLSGARPVPQKLISSPYEREESATEKANNQPEYQVRYASPTENPAKYYQEAIKTGPKNSFVPLPKHQYLSESDNSPANANLAKKHSQLIYQKQHQHAASAQQGPKGPHRQPTKAAGSFSEKLPQFQTSNHNAPSQSSIFVSQGTGVQQKPQEVENEQQPQEIQHVQQQQQQQYQHAQQQPHHQHVQQPHHHPQRLPLTNPNRPLTQEEFQALVDAGYKVQAIPIPVPVPVSAEEYAQHQHQYQQENQQHHQQYQQQQPQAQLLQQQQHQRPYQSQQPNIPARPQYQPQSNPSIRPQPSNKHYVRYHQQPTEGVLTSYLRPFLEQYNNLMGGKI